MSNVDVIAARTHATISPLAVRLASSSGPSHYAPQRFQLRWSGEPAKWYMDEGCIYQQMLTILGNYYDIRGRKAVLRFIVEHKELSRILIEAVPALVRYFGANNQVTLEIVTDPEAENEHELVAYVQTSLAVAEALRRLDSFDREWFLTRLDRTKGLFNVNLVFA